MVNTALTLLIGEVLLPAILSNSRSGLHCCYSDTRSRSDGGFDGDGVWILIRSKFQGVLEDSVKINQPDLGLRSNRRRGESSECPSCKCTFKVNEM
jgi:hypothetical protein